MGGNTSRVRTVAANSINTVTPTNKELMEECEWPGDSSASEFHTDYDFISWKYSSEKQFAEMGITSDVEDTRHTVENQKITGYSSWPPMNTNHQVRCNLKKETDGLLQSILEFKDKLSSLPSTAYDKIMFQYEKVQENSIQTLEQQQTCIGIELKMYRNIIQNFNEQLQLLKELQELERQISDAHIKRDLLQQDIEEIQRRLLLLEKQKDIFCNISPEPTELCGIQEVENKLNLRRQNTDLELQKLDQLQHRMKEVMDKLNAIIQEQLKFNHVQTWYTTHIATPPTVTVQDLATLEPTYLSFEFGEGNTAMRNTQLNVEAVISAMLKIVICLLNTAVILLRITLILLRITHAWPTSLEQQVQKCLNLILLSSGDVERNPGPRRMTDDDLANVDDTSLRKEDLFSVYDAVFDSRKKWFDLCLALRVSVDDLAAIDLNHHGDPSSCLRHGLTHWLQGHYDVKKYGPPTWRLLVDAVANSAGGNDYALAWEIKRCHEATHLIASRESQRAGNSLKKLNHSEELCSAFSTMYQRIITLLKRVDIGEVKELLHFLPNPRCPQQHYVPPAVYEDATCTKELLRDKLYPQYINPENTFVLEEIVSKFGSSTCKRLLQNYIYRFK